MMMKPPQSKPKTTIDNSTPAPADLAAIGGELGEQELSKATGGADATGVTFLRFDFKLVAVKT